MKEIELFTLAYYEVKLIKKYTETFNNISTRSVKKLLYEGSMTKMIFITERVL